MNYQPIGNLPGLWLSKRLGSLWKQGREIKMITEAQAMEAVGHLTSLTTGWPDEAVMAYATQLMEVDDARALRIACERIARTWTEARRPPLALIFQAYNAEVARSTPETRQIGSRVVPFAQGIEIAWEAYCREVRSQGREPDRRKFEKWLPT